MRVKKMILSVILITTVMLFAGGCGNVQAEPVSAEAMETVKKVDTEESIEPIPTPTAEPEESMESSEAPDNSEKEVDTTEEIISIDDTVMYATSKCNIRSGAGTQYDKVGSLSYAQEVTINGKVKAGEDKWWYVIKTEDGSVRMVSASMLSETKPVAQISSGSVSGSDSNSGSSTKDTGNSQAQTEKPAQTAPAPEPVPVHEHTWKEHTATKQTWVPNIVVVDDYETRIVEYYLFICYCDFETTDADTIAQHVKNHALTGEIELSGFGIQDHSYTEQVKVGSHEEDQGHYETSTYVDYYYCECGATQ